MSIESPLARPRTGVSRRRVIQGAAWATPAVLIATAAPALAASPGAAVSGLSAIIYQSGNSANFYCEITANVSGVASGEIITITAMFDTGAAVINPTDNSSGWAVTSAAGSGESFMVVAQRTHDGTGTLAVAKFKLTADIDKKATTLADELAGKTVTLTFAVGAQSLGTFSTTFPAEIG